MLVIDEMKDRRRVMLDTDEGVGERSGAATTGRRVLASWAQVERLGGADGAGDGVTRRGAGGTALEWAQVQVGGGAAVAAQGGNGMDFSHPVRNLFPISGLLYWLAVCQNHELYPSPIMR